MYHAASCHEECSYQIIRVAISGSANIGTSYKKSRVSLPLFTPVKILTKVRPHYRVKNGEDDGGRQAPRWSDLFRSPSYVVVVVVVFERTGYAKYKPRSLKRVRHDRYS